MLNDLRIACRNLGRNPGVALAAALTLALGIGANVAVFSVLSAVLLGSVGAADADRVIVVSERRSASGGSDLPVSGHEFEAWREQTRALDRIAITHTAGLNFTGRGEPELVKALRVSADYYAILGLRAAHGRVPDSDEAAAARVAVLSDHFWRRRFGGLVGVIGQTILLDDEAFTVIGVAEPLPPSLEPDLWLAIDVAAEALAVGRHNLGALARLAPGATQEQAQAELDVISARLEAERPGDNTGHRAYATPLRKAVVGEFERPLLILAAAVAFVLLIACANVTNLLLARNAARRREMAVRVALGASRWRLVRLLLIESLALSVLGGIAGLLVAAWTLAGATRLTAVRIPMLETARLDTPALLAAVLISMLAGVVAGLLPALRSARSSSRMLREIAGTRDRRGRRVHSTLIAAEVALTLTLLVGTGLLVNSFVRLTRVDAGFRSRGVLVVPIDLPGTRYADAIRRHTFLQELLRELRDVPGVTSAGAVSHLPLGGADNWMRFSLEGRPSPAPGQEPNAPFRVATAGYFETMGIPLRRGRVFTDRDARRALPLVRWYPQQPYPAAFDEPQPEPVAVISETAAREFWPGEDPVGKRFRVLFSPDITVIGVVGDVRHNALSLPAYPQVYLSHNQEPWNSFSVVLRAEAGAAVATAVRERIRALDAALPITMREMDGVRGESIGRPRFFMLLIGLFGAVALGLAVIGIFGVVSYLVGERMRELGVRVALGAQRGEILRLIVAQEMLPIAVGLVVGTAAALLLTQSLRTLLYDVEPTDPLTFLAVAALLVAAALAACVVPARRAARLDPVRVLRDP